VCGPAWFTSPFFAFLSVSTNHLCIASPITSVAQGPAPDPRPGQSPEPNGSQSPQLITWHVPCNHRQVITTQTTRDAPIHLPRKRRCPDTGSSHHSLNASKPPRVEPVELHGMERRSAPVCHVSIDVPKSGERTRASAAGIAR